MNDILIFGRQIRCNYLYSIIFRIIACCSSFYRRVAKTLERMINLSKNRSMVPSFDLGICEFFAILNKCIFISEKH